MRGESLKLMNRQKLLEESRNSKHAFMQYHTHHTARLCTRLAALSIKSKSLPASPSSPTPPLAHYAAAALYLETTLAALGFNVESSHYMRQNQYLAAVADLAHVQIIRAQLENRDMLESLKKEMVLNRQKLLSTLDKYKKVF